MHIAKPGQKNLPVKTVVMAFLLCCCCWCFLGPPTWNHTEFRKIDNGPRTKWRVQSVRSSSLNKLSWNHHHQNVTFNPFFKKKNDSVRNPHEAKMRPKSWDECGALAAARFLQFKLKTWYRTIRKYIFHSSQSFQWFLKDKCTCSGIITSLPTGVRNEVSESSKGNGTWIIAHVLG
jgi:hypothetical protein